MTNNKLIKALKERSKVREDLLEKIVKSNDPLDNFIDPDNFLILSREWNSWYPSTFKISGGCYFFNINGEVIIIDPGFNTLKNIIDNDLDIRLIRYIFVTHFHPDHYVSLSKLLTRLPSSKHKVSVYLNPTTFKQFNIYMREYTDFYELIPGTIYDLNTKANSIYKIEIETTKAFHREIGGFMNSIGLKFKLTHNKKKCSFIIGFMGDTDGHCNYMDYYKDMYDDCHVVIPHLGSIHSKPKGYKHLYLNGVKSLLKILKKEDKVFFLGEFGLELGDDDTFYRGLEYLVSSKISYMNLTNNILRILNNEKDKDLKNHLNPILQLLKTRFESIVKNLSGNLILKLEIFLPFIISYKTKKYKEKKDNKEPKDDTDNKFKEFSNLGKNIELFLKNITEEKFKKVVWSFLKKFALGADLTNDYKKLFIELLNDVGLAELRQNMDLNCESFIPLWDNDFRDLFWKKIFKAIIPRYGNITLGIDIFLPKGLGLNVNSKQDPWLETSIINFLNAETRLTSLFKKPELFNNEKISWFILLIILYFSTKIREIERLNDHSEFSDGRVQICQYLHKRTDQTIIPVHNSYKIIFKESGIECEGYCCNYHRQTIPLLEINSDVELLKNTDLGIEYVNIIPENRCIRCYYESEKSRYKTERDQEQEEMFKEEFEESHIILKQSADNRMKQFQDLDVFFNYFNNSYMEEEFLHISDVILKIKLIKLIDQTGLTQLELILYLIHPMLIKRSVIQEIVELKLNLLSSEEVLQLLLKIFKNPSPYNELEIYPIYLDLLYNENLVKMIFSKIKNEEISFNFLAEALDYIYRVNSFKKSLRRNNFVEHLKRCLIEIL